MILGNHYTPQAAAKVNAVLGLKESIPHQYVTFLDKLVHGNLGYSFFEDLPARTVIDQHVPADAVGHRLCRRAGGAHRHPGRLVSGMRRNGVFDQASRVFFTVSYAIPSFWLGLILVLVLGLYAGIFPIDGYGTGFFGHLYYLLLPAFTLALPFSTVIVRALRSSVISVSRTEYVDTARIKGISSTQVMVRHIARNAIITVISVFGVNLAYLVGGTVLIENVFSIPGLGSLLVSSVSDRDYPVVQGITLVFALAIVAINLLTDVTHALLDPRVGVGTGE